MRVLFSLCFLLVFGSQVFAQDPGVWNSDATTRLDELLEKMHDNHQFNGAVLLAEDGKTVYEKSLGVANINDGRKLTPASSFRLASVSKQFTAMGIMLLQEAGKLNYDDDIRKHVPELPYEGITIRHLLNHTGGLADYMALFEKKWNPEKPEPDRATAFNSDLVELFAKHKPDIGFKPGERFEYSNTGYVLLAVIIERVSEQPIKQFLNDRIFVPLEMNHTSAFSPGDDFVLPQRVYGFSWTVDGKSHEDNDWNFLNGMIGDGGIYASVRDLLKWDQALYGEKLIKQATLEQAFTTGKTNDGEETGYGFGWAIESANGKPVRVVHGGGWVGFRTSIERNLRDKQTTIVLTNHSSNHLGVILAAVEKIKKGESVKPPEPGTFGDRDEDVEDAVELSAETLEAYMGQFELTPDFVITITRSEKQLFGQATGQPQFQLRSLTETKFKVIGVDAQLTFNKSANGRIDSVTLHQGGFDQKADRIK